MLTDCLKLNNILNLSTDDAVELRILKFSAKREKLEFEQKNKFIKYSAQKTIFINHVSV